jgi:hypothetical protein
MAIEVAASWKALHAWEPEADDMHLFGHRLLQRYLHWAILDTTHTTLTF